MIFANKNDFDKICTKAYCEKGTVKTYQLESLLKARTVKHTKTKLTSVVTQRTSGTRHHNKNEETNKLPSGNLSLTTAVSLPKIF